jgi:MFS family permease
VDVKVQGGSGVTRRRNPLPRTFASFRSYNYRLFWFGQLISQIGTWMQRIGQSWLVLQLTDSPTALGLVTALQFAPILVFSLFAGAWLDRMPKHKVVIVTQCLALVQAILLAVPTIMGTIQLWQIYALALLLGAINAFDNPARQSFVMEMVGRENIVNAVALNSAQFNGSRLLGPAIGGLMIAAWGVGVCFAVNAVSFLAVLVGLLMMRPDQFFNVPDRTRPREPLSAQLGGGLKFVFGRMDLAVVMVVASVIQCFGFNFNVLMPLIAEKEFQAGPDAFGLLMTAIGAGSVISAFAVATIGRSSMRAMLLAAAVFGGLEFAAASSPWFPLELMLLIGVGYAGMIFTSSANTLMQLSSPDHLRGRVMSVYSMIFTGTTPFGSLITGYAAGALSARAAFGIEGALCLVVPIGALAFVRRSGTPSPAVLTEAA